MENLKTELTNLTLELKELIKCQVCRHSFSGYGSECKNGHVVHDKCVAKKKLTRCPTCDSELVVEQSPLLRQLLQKIPQPCRYTDKGCTEIVLSRDHETFCPFRPAWCDKCECECCVNGLVCHVRTNHAELIIECEGLGVKTSVMETFDKTTECRTIIHPYTLKQNVFWVLQCIDRKSKRHTYEVYYHPTSEPTEDFYLIVTFKKNELELKSIAKAYQEDFVDKGSGLVIPDDLLDLFLAENESDKYKCT